MTGTLFVAILGVVLAALSLGWQAATFALTGSRVRAELRHGAFGAGGSGFHNKPGKLDMAMMASQGMSLEVIGVEVWNSGRLATTVTGFGVRTDKGMMYSPIGDRIGDPMPYRLEPGATAAWFMPMEPVRDAVATSGHVLRHPNPATVRAVIDLGTRRSIKAKGSMSVNG